MFEPPQPFEPAIQPKMYMYRELSPEAQAAREAAKREAEAREEAARQVASFLEAVREAARLDATLYASLDESGWLWLQPRHSDGQ